MFNNKFCIIKTGDVSLNVNLCAPVYPYVPQMQAFILYQLNPQIQNDTKNAYINL